MELGTTLFGLARKASGWLYAIAEKRVCRRAYELSTQYHDHRTLIEARPHPLGEHLGFRLFTDAYLHGERQSAPVIEVITNRGVRLSKVVIAVSAFNDKACHQNEVVLRQVDGRRHRAALTAVPFRRLKFKGNMVYTPYDTLRIELIEIRDQSGEDIMPRWPVVQELHPIDRLEVALGEEQEYVERWGRVYNLRFIEMQIREELVHISAWRFHHSAFVRKLTEKLQHRRVAKLLFWAKNAVWARPLHGELAQHIAEYRDYEASRLRRERAESDKEEV